jgi:sialic acid synthase SpsE
VASGREKKVHDREKEIRQWAFRSLVTTAQLCAGERISQEKIWSKRPGTGIPSYRMDEVIGRTARRDIPGNTLLSWEDLEP